MNTVTKEDVLDNMKDFIVRTVIEFDKPCTYVTVRMKNGFTIRESTTCVDPNNYSEEIGKQICLEKIEDKIWFLLGYALQDKLYKDCVDAHELDKYLKDLPGTNFYTLKVIPKKLNDKCKIGLINIFNVNKFDQMNKICSMSLTDKTGKSDAEIEECLKNDILDMLKFNLMYAIYPDKSVYQALIDKDFKGFI